MSFILGVVCTLLAVSWRDALQVPSAQPGLQPGEVWNVGGTADDRSNLYPPGPMDHYPPPFHEPGPPPGGPWRHGPPPRHHRPGHPGRPPGPMFPPPIREPGETVQEGGDITSPGDVGEIVRPPDSDQTSEI